MQLEERIYIDVVLLYRMGRIDILVSDVEVLADIQKQQDEPG